MRLNRTAVLAALPVVLIVIIGAGLRLWQIGPHSIVDHVNARAFAANTKFRRREKEVQPTDQPILFEAPAAWMQPQNTEAAR